MKYHTSIVFSLAALFLLIGCKSPQSVDPLLGQWQVKDIIREGKSIVPPGFKGANYLFKEDGKVLAWTQQGDSSEVSYAHRGDSLFWVSPEDTQYYLIDSLSEDFMQFDVDQDGFKSRLVLVKIKN